MSSRFIAAFPKEGPPEYRFARFLFSGLIERYLVALGDPQKAQVLRFRHLMGLFERTEFGNEHGLSRTMSLAAFRSSVPVRRYSDLSPWMERVVAGTPNVLARTPVQAFMETSGTSGAPKLIPVTREWSNSISDAQKIWLSALLRDHPGAARGRALMVVSSAMERRTETGIPIGANTGRMHRRQPFWVRRNGVLSDSVLSIADPAIKQYCLLRHGLQHPISSWTTANPSMILLLCRRLLEWREHLTLDLRAGSLQHGPAAKLSPEQRGLISQGLVCTAPPLDWRPARIWPLAVINCWTGGPSAYFVHRIPEALGADIPIREVGVTASEGFFAIPLGVNWGGGALWTLGHLLEFEDKEGDVHWAWELEVGRKYNLIITSENGLVRYDLRDTVEVIGFAEKTPVIRFVGKTGRYLNALGEKITEAQLSQAVRDVCLARSVDIVGFSAALKWGDVPCLQLFVEGEVPPDFSKAIDGTLAALNVEYASKRSSGRMGDIEQYVLPKGAYLRYQKEKVAAGATQSQLKDPIFLMTPLERASFLGEG